MQTCKPNLMVTLLGIAAFFPATISAATTFTIGFDSSDDLPTATTNVSTNPAIAVSGGLLIGVASSGDPQLVWRTATVSSTPIVSKLESETWSTIVFRVRETASPLTPGTVVDTYDGTGLLTRLSSNNSPTGAVSDNNRSAVASGDGFFTYTADISGFTANDIRYIRVDPIGGGDAADNRFEIDFIQINAIPEPTTMILGSLGTLALLRRRR